MTVAATGGADVTAMPVTMQLVDRLRGELLASIATLQGQVGELQAQVAQQSKYVKHNVGSVQALLSRVDSIERQIDGICPPGPVQTSQLGPGSKLPPLASGWGSEFGIRCSLSLKTAPLLSPFAEGCVHSSLIQVLDTHADAIWVRGADTKAEPSVSAALFQLFFEIRCPTAAAQRRASSRLSSVQKSPSDLFGSLRKALEKEDLPVPRFHAVEIEATTRDGTQAIWSPTGGTERVRSGSESSVPSSPSAWSQRSPTHSADSPNDGRLSGFDYAGDPALPGSARSFEDLFVWAAQDGNAESVRGSSHASRQQVPTAETQSTGGPEDRSSSYDTVGHQHANTGAPGGADHAESWDGSTEGTTGAAGGDRLTNLNDSSEALSSSEAAAPTSSGRGHHEQGRSSSSREQHTVSIPDTIGGASAASSSSEMPGQSDMPSESETLPSSGSGLRTEISATQAANDFRNWPASYDAVPTSSGITEAVIGMQEQPSSSEDAPAGVGTTERSAVSSPPHGLETHTATETRRPCDVLPSGFGFQANAGTDGPQAWPGGSSEGFGTIATPDPGVHSHNQWPAAPSSDDVARSIVPDADVRGQQPWPEAPGSNEAAGSVAQQNWPSSGQHAGSAAQLVPDPSMHSSNDAAGNVSQPNWPRSGQGAASAAQKILPSSGFVVPTQGGEALHPHDDTRTAAQQNWPSSSPATIQQDWPSGGLTSPAQGEAASHQHDVAGSVAQQNWPSSSHTAGNPYDATGSGAQQHWSDSGLAPPVQGGATSYPQAPPKQTSKRGKSHRVVAGVPEAGTKPAYSMPSQANWPAGQEMVPVGGFTEIPSSASGIPSHSGWPSGQENIGFGGLANMPTSFSDWPDGNVGENKSKMTQSSAGTQQTAWPSGGGISSNGFEAWSSGTAGFMATSGFKDWPTGDGFEASSTGVSGTPAATAGWATDMAISTDSFGQRDGLSIPVTPPTGQWASDPTSFPMNSAPEMPSNNAGIRSDEAPEQGILNMPAHLASGGIAHSEDRGMPGTPMLRGGDQDNPMMRGDQGQERDRTHTEHLTGPQRSSPDALARVIQKAVPGEYKQNKEIGGLASNIPNMDSHS